MSDKSFPPHVRVNILMKSGRVIEGIVLSLTLEYLLDALSNQYVTPPLVTRFKISSDGSHAEEYCVLTNSIEGVSFVPTPKDLAEDTPFEDIPVFSDRSSV